MNQIPHTVWLHMGHSNTDSAKFTHCFNNNFYLSDQDAQIWRWLSPLEPQSRHEGVRAGRFAGVGNWLLETSDFRKWRGGEGGFDKATLFCSGKPGVGKTYLSSLVMDSLWDKAGEGDIAVAGLYYDFLDQQEQTASNVIGAILRQLVCRGNIPKYLHDAFQKEFGGRRLLLPDLMPLLKTAIASLPPVFICIDALDECLPQHLPKLLQSLRDIVVESPGTRIFLTGRPYVSDAIQKYFSGMVGIPISPNADEIRSYLKRRLDEDDEPNAMNKDLQAEIVNAILENMSDTFLLVSLNIDAILGGVTIGQRRKKLEVMAQGNGLSDAYTATLARLKAQKGDKSKLGMKVLMWVLYSKRPLRVEELRHALGVEIGSSDLDPEMVPAEQTLVASCLGLVVVEESSSTVRLMHFTLREHLLTVPDLFRDSHSIIAEVCLTYLNFRCFWDISQIPDSVPPEMHLQEYASCYGEIHAKSEVTESVRTLGLKLLNRQAEQFGRQFAYQG